MPRKTTATYTNYPLPEGSSALQTLDAFCEEWGNISRADATQRIIIAWAKARGGDLTAMAAMGLTVSVVGSATTSTDKVEMPGVPTTDNKPVVRRTNSNAKSVELDL